MIKIYFNCELLSEKFSFIQFYMHEGLVIIRYIFIYTNYYREKIIWNMSLWVDKHRPKKLSKLDYHTEQEKIAMNTLFATNSIYPNPINLSWISGYLAVNIDTVAEWCTELGLNFFKHNFCCAELYSCQLLNRHNTWNSLSKEVISPIYLCMVLLGLAKRLGSCVFLENCMELVLRGSGNK